MTRRLRSTFRRLADRHPELGRHLEVSGTAGLSCRYRPEHPITWLVSSPQGSETP